MAHGNCCRRVRACHRCTPVHVEVSEVHRSIGRQLFVSRKFGIRKWFDLLPVGIQCELFWEWGGLHIRRVLLEQHRESMVYKLHARCQRSRMSLASLLRLGFRPDGTGWYFRYVVLDIEKVQGTILHIDHKSLENNQVREVAFDHRLAISRTVLQWFFFFFLPFSIQDTTWVLWQWDLS